MYPSRYVPLFQDVTKRFLAPLLVALPVLAAATIVDRIYDFSDAFYRANGVDPTKIGGRPQPGPSAVTDVPNKPSQRNVRITRTFIGYGASGGTIFFTVHGGNGYDLFTKDAAGQKAQGIADSFAEYIFPQRGTNPVGIGNTRQSFVHQNNGGYVSKNPLGLWIHVWISYTDKAFGTKDGQKELADLMRKNGPSLDGTPILKTTSEIDNLYRKGYVTKVTTQDASRYAICPEILDPRDGGIAPDATTALVLRKADGTLLEPALVDAFNSLQKTGDWPNNR